MLWLTRMPQTPSVDSSLPGPTMSAAGFTPAKAVALTVIVVPRVNVDGFDGKKADATPLTHATGTQEVAPWRER